MLEALKQVKSEEGLCAAVAKLPASAHAKLVEMGLDQLTDAGSAAAEGMKLFIPVLVRGTSVSAQAFKDGLRAVLEMLDELLIDAPL